MLKKYRVNYLILINDMEKWVIFPMESHPSSYFSEKGLFDILLTGIEWRIQTKEKQKEDSKDNT